jgi:hypothetical protein
VSVRPLIIPPMKAASGTHDHRNISEDQNGHIRWQPSGAARSDDIFKSPKAADSEINKTKCSCCFWRSHSKPRSADTNGAISANLEKFTVTADTVHFHPNKPPLSSDIETATAQVNNHAGETSIPNRGVHQLTVSAIRPTNNVTDYIYEATSAKGPHQITVVKVQHDQQATDSVFGSRSNLSIDHESEAEPLSTSVDSNAPDRARRTIGAANRAWSNPPESGHNRALLVEFPKWWERRPSIYRSRQDEASAQRPSFLRWTDHLLAYTKTQTLV